MSEGAPGARSPDAGGVPWWGLAAAACGPMLLIGGWTVAAARQPPSYDPRTDTISALAAEGATDRWVMTFTFTGIGICYVVSALALRQPALPGRYALVVGGLATMLVAIVPQPHDGPSDHHGVFAAVASVSIAVWPVLAARRGPHVPWVLRPGVGLTVSVVTIALLCWFARELQRGMLAGLSERFAAGSEALWLLVATVALRRAALRSERAALRSQQPARREALDTVEGEDDA